MGWTKVVCARSERVQTVEVYSLRRLVSCGRKQVRVPSTSCQKQGFREAEVVVEGAEGTANRGPD